MNQSFSLFTQNCWFSLRMPAVRYQIKKLNPDIVCLQEITSIRIAHKLQKLFPNYSVISSESYPAAKVLKFRNVILTKFEAIDRGELNFRLQKTSRMLRGKVIWITVNISGNKVRIYNCHLVVFGQGMEGRAELLKNIMTHAMKFKGPVIITGDMNTGMPKATISRNIVKLWTRYPLPDKEKVGHFADHNEKFYFAAVADELGFAETFDLHDSTWRIPGSGKKMSLKLDWMFYKNLKPVKTHFGPYIGDHRGMMGEFMLYDSNGQLIIKN